jgi:uncharacterized protein (DUF305 family)
MPVLRRLVLPFALLAVGLAGCSHAAAEGAGSPVPSVGQPTVTVSEPSVTAPTSTRGVNATDVMFAQMLVPHHGQGVALAKLAATRSSSTEIKQLAAAIAATQPAEISLAAGWLRAWKQPPVAPAGGHASHGGMPSTSPAEFAALTKASGAAFDRRFLNTLIAHQDDAIQIAAMETGSGVNPQARALAQRIQISRKAQIDQMLKIIGRL